MQDFAHLFSDSVAAWLKGRGDSRFVRYERHYKAERNAAQRGNGGGSDLERSNEQYTMRCARSGGRLVRVLDSRHFRRLALFLALLWGGSGLLSTMGKSQPTAVGIVLAAVFVAIRISRRRRRTDRG